METLGFRVQIERDWCKACGICIAFCPTGTLVKDNDGKARVGIQEDCTGCGLCERLCPDLAIEVVRLQALETPA